MLPQQQMKSTILRLVKMNKRNFQKEMDSIIEQNQKDGITPSLLLHSCCAPCSSYVLEYLSKYFKITVLYYNPNISPKEEYIHRLKEEKRLISEMSFENPVSIIDCSYDSQEFFSCAKGLEKESEGGKRCEKCFDLRLSYTAKTAKEKGFDYFATTLTISPLKNAQLINEIGESLGEKFNVKYLCSDFKKKEGYKRSIILSKEYNLYRQNYCGCIFSKAESDKTPLHS